ncbi:MAG: internal scaffolding protein [Microviridae sp.]|nr:MAG: internal scaffolding protein [Microviridae sp.]
MSNDKSLHTQPVSITSPLPLPISSNNTHPRFRSAYSPRHRLQLIFAGPGRTKQSFKDECDINVIMKRYQATGILEHTREAAGQFLDVSGIEFQSAMNVVAEAQSLFADLPAQIRSRFENDPARLLDWVHDPKNVQEAASLGFLDLGKLPEGSPYLPAAKSAPAPSGAAGEGGKGDASPKEGA